MKISLIAAASSNLVIGLDGDLPWRLPTDLKHFKNITKGHHILMGRKTWDSLGKPLPDRTSLVISRKKMDLPEGAFGFTNIEEAIALASKNGEEELMVIGGGEIYRQMLHLANKIYFSHVYTKIENGTAFFPALSPENWKITESFFLPRGEKNPFSIDFLVLEKI
jgi:dihydrofolate reductase